MSRECHRSEDHPRGVAFHCQTYAAVHTAKPSALKTVLLRAGQRRPFSGEPSRALLIRSIHPGSCGSTPAPLHLPGQERAYNQGTLQQTGRRVCGCDAQVKLRRTQTCGPWAARPHLGRELPAAWGQCCTLPAAGCGSSLVFLCLGSCVCEEASWQDHP